MGALADVKALLERPLCSCRGLPCEEVYLLGVAEAQAITAMQAGACASCN
jgi:hypothetical protein